MSIDGEHDAADEQGAPETGGPDIEPVGLPSPLPTVDGSRSETG